jgi:hypothetical protein
VQRVAARRPTGRHRDAIALRLQCVEIEVDARVLTQLVLEPVDDAGADGGVADVAQTGEEHLVLDRERLLVEGLERGLDSGRSVDGVHVVEEVEPLPTDGQLLHGRRLVGEDLVDHARIAGQRLQDDDRSRARTEHNRRRGRDSFDHLPDIVRVGLQPAFVILRGRPVGCARSRAGRR